MTTESQTGFRVVDKRHSQTADSLSSQRRIPADSRGHSVLLGYHSEDQARRFLQDKGVQLDLVEELMEERKRAQVHIQTLVPADARPAALPLEDEDAITEIDRVMMRPDCKAVYPEGSWTAELVEISKIIPLLPNLDVDYAESLGGPGLNPSDLISAVKLCFAERPSTSFHLNVDESQKAISILGINPALEVVGLRYAQQGEGGPLVVSFMVSPPPNIVTLSRYAGRHFLSSGYHRVYRLLKAGFSHVPCAVREARSLAQVVAYGPGCFAEAMLLSPRPPLFPDFADPILGIIAPLRAVQRVIRIRPDEHFVF